MPEPCEGLAQILVILVKEKPLGKEHHKMIGHIFRFQAIFKSEPPNTWIFRTLTWAPLASSYHQDVKTGPSRQWV